MLYEVITDHDSKGIKIRLKDVTQPDGERTITLKWDNVAKRIADLVSTGTYITQEDIQKRINDNNIFDNDIYISPSENNEVIAESHLINNDSLPSELINYVFNDNDIIMGGQKTRFNANIEAIKTLQLIESENRYATSDEQSILAGFV